MTVLILYDPFFHFFKAKSAHFYYKFKQRINITIYTFEFHLISLQQRKILFFLCAS